MEVEKPKPPISTLNFSNGAVWLVKIPNYLADSWIHAERGSELGTVDIIHEGSQPNDQPNVEMKVHRLPGMKDNIPLEFKYSQIFPCNLHQILNL